jgi:glycosyltransferase involved in cell wall biosynthesis
MTKTPVSICIQAYNEELLIADCLASAIGIAQEIVVLDAESSDRTVEIVKMQMRDHPEIVLISAPNLLNFDRNKNLTFEKASSDWIFYLDADERMTPELWKEIGETISNTQYTGFCVGRRNFYFGKWMRHGGMYPEKQPRLFRNGKGRMPGNELHETLQVDGSVGDLKNTFDHLAYRNMNQFMHKLDSYSRAQAEAWYKKGVRWNFANHVKYGVIRPFARFIEKYIVKAGFLDGFLGLFVAWIAGVSELLTYTRVGTDSHE